MANELLILDACVVIDFVSVDETILSDIITHVGRIHVASIVLAEVEDLDRDRAEQLGLQIVEPTIELLARASVRRPGLSIQDQVCLLLAADHSWTCVTNDAALRGFCNTDGIPVYWGLEVVSKLVKAGGLPATAAIEFVEGIASINPYITRKIVERFRKQLGED